MADFSIGSAAGAGFRLIARKPLAVLVWGLLIWALMLPLLLVVGSFVSVVLSAAQEAARHSAEPYAANAITDATNSMADATNAAISSATNGTDATNTVAAAAAAGGKPVDTYGNAPPPEVIAALARLFMIYPLIIIGALVVSGVLMGAVCRAILQPEDSSFAYLRVGMRELWLVLVNFVMRILLAFASIPIIIVTAVVGGIIAAVTVAASQGQTSAGVPVALGVVWVLTFFALAVVQIWLGMRLIMGLPMSFDHNQFRLFESWAFTRGHTWKLVGLLLLLVAMAIVLELIVAGVCFAVIASISGSTSMTHEQWRALLMHPPANWSTNLMVGVGLGSLALAILSGFANAIFMAPFVEAYRQLRDSGASGTPQYVPSLGEARPLS